MSKPKLLRIGERCIECWAARRIPGGAILSAVVSVQSLAIYKSRDLRRLIKWLEKAAAWLESQER